MNPKGVQTLMTHATRLSRQKVPPSIPFAIRWIAWESLRTRTLVVATRLAGWSTTDAYHALSVLHISSNEHFARCFFRVTTCALASHLDGDAAKAWRAIGRIEILRHRLFHGVRETRPDVLVPASNALGNFLKHRKKLFGRICVAHPCGTAFPIGDPLDKVVDRPKSSIARVRQELLELLGKDHRSKHGPKVPSITPKEAEDWNALFV